MTSTSPTDRAAAEFAAEHLERLVALPLDTPADQERWERECASFQTALETRFPTFELDHHVGHYFTDTDIRRTDEGYSQRQHQAVAAYVGRLRYGH